jgi:37-kD nucleoid-associated bacterial protein
MDLQNLKIHRIVFHEVHQRLDDRRLIQPTYGAQTLNLSLEAMGALRERIIAATGSQSQSMDMTIAKFDASSAAALAAKLIVAASDADFVLQSKEVANRLADAQQTRNIPGGVLAIFTGLAGNPALPLAGYIKAELHGGFLRAQNLTIEYIKTLFMTPQTKLYKIGLFSYDGGVIRPLPGGWTASVYDSHMSLANPEGAARYFFEGFLGLELPQSAPRMTRKFWESTRKFIQNSSIPEERKADLYTSLYSYLKVNQTPTVEVAVFANTYLEPSVRDRYSQYMIAESFPLNAVPKDLSELTNKLKKRRVNFSRDVQLSAPADAFAELIKIETVNKDGIPDTGGTWTRITVKDRIREQQ